MSIRNIIFDVDGTLIDSKIDITNAQVWTLHQLGVHHMTNEDLYPYLGKPLHETFALLLPRDLHHRIPDSVVMYRERYRPRAFENTRLYPGVKETLEILSMRKISLATATTKTTETTARVLRYFGVDRYFRHIQGTDAGMPYKPDPQIVQKILAEERWEKSETMIVGDTDKDIEVGRNAGIGVCGVVYGTYSKEQMAALAPDHLIESFPQLLTLV